MMLVSSTQLAEIMGVSKTSITNWKKAGLKGIKEGNKELFNVVDSLVWHGLNIQGSPLKAVCVGGADDSVDDELKRKRIEKIELELKIKRGEFVSIEDLDQTTAQLSALLVNQYRRHMRVLPKLLAKKTEAQIKRLLDKEFGTNVEELYNLYESGCYTDDELFQ